MPSAFCLQEPDMPTLLEKRESRAKIVSDARKLVDTAEAEKRSMTAEENASFEAHMADVDKLGDEITAEEKHLELRGKLDDAEQSMAESRGRRTDPGQPGETRTDKEKTSPEFRARFAHLPAGELAQIERRASPEYRAHYATWLAGGREYRDLQAGSDVSAGYLVAPIQFVDELIVAKKNLVFIRELATLHVVTEAQGLGAPSLDVDEAAPTWTSEISTGANDTTMRFGKRELFPHPLAKLIKISQKLLRVNTVSAEAVVRDRGAYQYAVTEENAFLNGTGNEQPLGIYVPSPMGISTGRDITTVGAGAISADDLIEVKYGLKQQYLGSKTLRWIAHRAFVKAVRKLKDSQGQYLWTTGLGIGRPDTLLDVPMAMSEYAPSTLTSGNYAAILGDIAYYWIADSLNLTIQRLNELYAQTNQVGFIFREEVDGMPVLEEAFSRLKIQ
jgi:HK97 family phage major capsid protein